MKTNQPNTKPVKTNTNHDNNVKGLRAESDRQKLPGGNGDQNRPQIDFALRELNRNLNTKALLALLAERAPEFFQMAQVVGKWVWIQFNQKQPATVTARLAEFGFHWNNKRQVWQHPCGPVTVDASPDDPRNKYGVTNAEAVLA